MFKCKKLELILAHITLDHISISKKDESKINKTKKRNNKNTHMHTHSEA